MSHVGKNKLISTHDRLFFSVIHVNDNNLTRAIWDVGCVFMFSYVNYTSWFDLLLLLLLFSLLLHWLGN